MVVENTDLELTMLSPFKFIILFFLFKQNQENPNRRGTNNFNSLFLNHKLENYLADEALLKFPTFSLG